MQEAIKKYRLDLGVTQEVLLPQEDHSLILKQLELIFKNLKGGKKKKQFINNLSKLNTVSSWIGRENAEAWFNSKEQRQ